MCRLRSNGMCQNERHQTFVIPYFKDGVTWRNTRFQWPQAATRARQFIERTFESLIAQRYENMEWSVVVDGLLDDTLPLLEKFRATAPFPVHITVFDINRGATTAIAAAIQRCSGEFTIILDHDDELLSGRAEESSWMLGISWRQALTLLESVEYLGVA